MKLEIKQEGEIYRLVYTDEKGAATLGRRHPDQHSALRTRARYLLPQNLNKLLDRVASARGEVERVRSVQVVPVEKEAANG